MLRRGTTFQNWRRAIQRKNVQNSFCTATYDSKEVHPTAINGFKDAWAYEKGRQVSKSLYQKLTEFYESPI